MLTIAVIGSGPTGIYTVKYLLERCADISITLFEEQAQAGKGTPYHQDWNDAEMLANIASIEIPPIHETLEEWLNSQSEYELGDIGIAREDISDRAFYPRVALGEYFASQLQILARSAQNSGNELHLYTNCKVVDVALGNDRVVVFAQPEKDTVKEHRFDYAVMATGHTWPKESEVRPGYFLSPWPAQALKTIGNCHVGIRGTSLSAIDAAVALSVARGMFERNAEGKLIYLSEPGTDDFHITMMSRKGILPEADFYHPIPYEPLSKCTAEAIAELIKQVPGEELLSAVFALFKRELALCDPHYAAAIGIESLTQETFASAYFSERERYDAFDWARHNLEEAKRHQEIEYTVPWRYAILRMHEPIGQIVPHLMAEGHKQFQKYLKSVFVDNYATVPHESIERMLALHEAGKLDVLQLGKVYEIDTKVPEGGALVTLQGKQTHYPAFIEALGQRPLSLHDFPFPTLWKQGVVQKATAPYTSDEESAHISIGGIALDDTFHPLSDERETSRLYCLSLPFILGQYPFAQGITSSHSMAEKVANDILDRISVSAVSPVFQSYNSA